jgi:C-terminal binding protein
MEVVHIQGNLGAPGYGLTMKDVPDEICAKVHGLFMFRHFLEEEEINRYPNLRVVVRMGVGYDRLDRKALAKRGVKVCNIPGEALLLRSSDIFPC